MRTFQRVFTAVGMTALAITATLGGAAAAPASATTTGAEAAGGTLTVFSATQLYRADQYYAPAFSSLQNYVSPVNWSAGRAKLQLQILSKPSSRAMLAQVCFWQHAGGVKFKYETCAKPQRITDEGSWTVDLGTPASWWDKNGFYPWNNPPSVVRILLKDAASPTVMNSKNCKPVCYRGSDLAQHVPVNIKATLTITR